MKLLKSIFRGILFFICFLFFIFVYARYIEPQLLVKTKLSTHSSSINQPFKVVFFSDTHFGKLYKQTNITKIVQAINEQEADFVIFGGDFFDNFAKDQSVLDVQYLEEQLANIQAKHGKIAIWGNHDYGGGAVRIYESFMQKGGFTVLKNQSLAYPMFNITISGVDDYLFGNPDFSLINQPYKQNQPYHLVLSHQPDLVDRFMLSNINFILSGHSHGGQVSLPFLTKQVLPIGAKKYVKGSYSLNSSTDTTLFVSKGIGLTQLPFRFLNIPEIVVVQFNPVN